jgi:type I restriction enzyme S subunit
MDNRASLAWTEAAIEDCLEALIDYRGKTPKKTSSGIPLITAKVIKNGTINEPNEFIDANDYHAWMRRGIPKPGDVIMTTEAPLGEVAILPDRQIALAQRVVVMRGRVDTLDNRYLKYFLQSEAGQQRLRQRSSGTTVMGIRQAELRKVNVSLPPIETQKAIASILGALDDKIDLNRRMNETLESMARALYKSWFVDFDPVVAKAAGKKPFGMDDATAALFPDRFVESELGPIPEGWEISCFGDVAEFHDSKRVPLSKHQRLERPGPYRYYGAAGILDHIDGYLFDGRFLLVGEDGSVINEAGYPVTQYVWGKFWANNHAHVLSGKAGVSVETLYLHMSGYDILPFVTGAVQPKLNQRNLKSTSLSLPPRQVVSAFQNKIEGWFELFRQNDEESQTLAHLRDLLLPKLISGEIRIKDAEKVVEEVV